jgi:hypothetical protein
VGIGAEDSPWVSKKVRLAPGLDRIQQALDGGTELPVSRVFDSIMLWPHPPSLT